MQKHIFILKQHFLHVHSRFSFYIYCIRQGEIHISTGGILKAFKHTNLTFFNLREHFLYVHLHLNYLPKIFDQAP